MTSLNSFSYTLTDIQKVVPEFWEIARNYNIIAFSGEMGAGKTTFIHALCDFLGVSDDVSSPTFAIINEYHLKNETNQEQTIFHMDWYRLKNTQEAIDAGIEDCLLNRDAYSFIEWPEKALELLSYPHLWVRIKDVSEQERMLEICVKH